MVLLKPVETYCSESHFNKCALLWKYSCGYARFAQNIDAWLFFFRSAFLHCVKTCIIRFLWAASFSTVSVTKSIKQPCPNSSLNSGEVPQQEKNLVLHFLDFSLGKINETQIISPMHVCVEQLSCKVYASRSRKGDQYQWSCVPLLRDVTPNFIGRISVTGTRAEKRDRSRRRGLWESGGELKNKQINLKK